MPSLTVVIPVHNSEKTLSEVVHRVQAELAPGDCILAVDDRSTDGSVEILARLGVPVVRSTGKPGAAGTRNTGGMAAKTEWILFLDSDAVPCRGFRAMLGTRMDGADAVQGVYSPLAPGKGAATFYKNYYYHHTFTKRIKGPFIKGCGTFFFAVRAAAFRELEGFDENIRGATIEDADFSERLWAGKGRILIAPEIEVFHLRQYEIAEFFRYEWNMMRAKALYIIRRSGDRGAPSISVAGFSEMIPVLVGALFSWVTVAGGVLLAAGAAGAIHVLASGFVMTAGFQLPLLRRMVMAGRVRGLRAALLIFPDLLLILPASLAAVFSAMAGRKY